MAHEGRQKPVPSRWNTGARTKMTAVKLCNSPISKLTLIVIMGCLCSCHSSKRIFEADIHPITQQKHVYANSFYKQDTQLLKHLDYNLIARKLTITGLLRIESDSTGD